MVEYGGRESPQAREDADMDANIVSTLSDLLASQEYDSVPCVPALECSDEERPQLKDVDQLINVSEVEGPRVHTVAVEVHKENITGPDKVEDAVSRKRAATPPDSDDVLTPGQRSGKKTWSEVTGGASRGSRTASNITRMYKVKVAPLASIYEIAIDLEIP
nr:uncharacterized protein LOC128696229 [Cherax quadricarinatus]